MSQSALFIDLPNFYSHLLNSDIDHPRLLRDYFLYWLDFDRLAEVLTGETTTTWIFYSGRRFGPKPNRIEGKYLDNYIRRINSLKGITARDVNIPGQQREPAKYKCEKCGQEGIAQWESEKGIDASLTVQLYDTMEAWDTAYLLSGDADFVPVVSSLRRRGKIIVGAGFSEVSSALVRECYDYIDLTKIFLWQDIQAYKVFREGGFAHKWLTTPLNFLDNIDINDIPKDYTATVRFGCGFIDTEYGVAKHCIVCEVEDDKRLDLSQWNNMISILTSKFGDWIQTSGYDNTVRYHFIISPNISQGIMRRFDQFTSSIDGILQSDEYLYALKQHYNFELNQFEIVTINKQR